MEVFILLSSGFRLPEPTQMAFPRRIFLSRPPAGEGNVSVTEKELGL